MLRKSLKVDALIDKFLCGCPSLCIPKVSQKVCPETLVDLAHEMMTINWIGCAITKVTPTNRVTPRQGASDLLN